jgi:hypothetical protein
MTDKITDKELKLADRINELSDAESRPVVTGGGLFAQAVNFLMRRVSRGIIATALIIFISYHGFEAFNGALQSMADLQTKRAEVGQTVAEANALRAKIGTDTLALGQMKAELEKTEQEAIATQAEADAQNNNIGDESVKLQTLRAEIERTKAEAQAAKAEADAQLQKIAGLPLIIQQKKSEVETAEAEMAAEVERHRLLVKQGLEIAKGINGMMSDSIRGTGIYGGR